LELLLMKKQAKIFNNHTGKAPGVVQGKTVPLHELAHACCSTGACRSVPYWPVDYFQEGLLQLDGAAGTDIPVELIGFSSRGVSVVMAAGQPIRQGAQGVLITQAHGAGCSYNRVVCCWHHRDPQHHQRQCVGLRFELQPPA
jgi:hypothetical protein